MFPVPVKLITLLFSTGESPPEEFADSLNPPAYVIPVPPPLSPMVLFPIRLKAPVSRVVLREIRSSTRIAPAVLFPIRRIFPWMLVSSAAVKFESTVVLSPRVIARPAV